MTFTGVKVFSATMVADRMVLGDRVSVWLEARRREPGFEVVDMVVSQSSDDSFHMIAITVFFRENGKPDASTLVRAREVGELAARADRIAKATQASEAREATSERPTIRLKFTR